MAGTKPARPSGRKPWRTWRRDAAATAALVSVLADHEVTLGGSPVDGRKVERISGAGLLFEPDVSDDEKVAHFRALDDLDYGSGKRPEELALRLLGRGHGAGLVRLVLAAFAPGLAALAEGVPFDEIEAIGSGSASPADDDLRAPFRVVLAALSKPFRQMRAAIDDAPVGGRETYSGQLLRETPQARNLAFFSDASRTMAGEPKIDDPDLLHDVAHAGAPKLFGARDRYEQRVALPEEIEAVERGAALLASAFTRYPEIVTTVPLSVLGTFARMARPMFSGPAFDDRARDIVAAIIAPVHFGMAQAAERSKELTDPT